METEAIQLLINNVPNLDAWLLAFVKNNMVALSLAMGALKIVAVEAKWATGNKIVSLFSNFMNRKNIL